MQQVNADTVWEVVGGGAKGGIIAREAISVDSPELPGRLATGALVREVEFSKDLGRLRFEKLSGEGPQSGWLSTSFRGKELLVKRAGTLPGTESEPQPEVGLPMKSPRHQMSMQEKIEFFSAQADAKCGSPKSPSVRKTSSASPKASPPGSPAGVASSASAEAAPGPDFEGRWVDADGSVNTIAGGELQMGGATATCKYTDGRLLEVTMDCGTRLCAQLLDGKLTWDDGDIWTRDDEKSSEKDGRSASMSAPHGPSQHEAFQSSMREGKLAADAITVDECEASACDAVADRSEELVKGAGGEAGDDNAQGQSEEYPVMMSLDGSSFDSYAPELCIDEAQADEDDGWHEVVRKKPVAKAKGGADRGVRADTRGFPSDTPSKRGVKEPSAPTSPQSASGKTDAKASGAVQGRASASNVSGWKPKQLSSPGSGKTPSWSAGDDNWRNSSSKAWKNDWRQQVTPKAKKLSWASDVSKDSPPSDLTSEEPATSLSAPSLPTFQSACEGSSNVARKDELQSGSSKGADRDDRGLDSAPSATSSTWSPSTIIPKKNKRLSWADICDLETCEGSDEWSDTPSTGTGNVTETDGSRSETAPSSTPSPSTPELPSAKPTTDGRGNGLTGECTGLNSLPFGALEVAVPMDNVDFSSQMLEGGYAFQPVAFVEAGFPMSDSMDAQSYQGYVSTSTIDMGSPEDIASKSFAYSCCFAPFEGDEALAWWPDTDGISTATPSPGSVAVQTPPSTRRKPKNEAHARALAAAQQHQKAAAQEHQSYQTAMWSYWWQGDGEDASAPVDGMDWQQMEECQMWECAPVEEQAFFAYADGEAASQIGDDACSYNKGYDEKSGMAASRLGWGGGSNKGDGASSNGSASGRERYNRRHVVPRKTDFTATDKGDTPITTVMIRNVPNHCTQKELKEELDTTLGLKGQYDFVYLPMDRSTRFNVGYGFVNFTSEEAAKTCTSKLAGQCFSRFPHGKPVVVSPAHLQGFEANVRHYRNSAVQNARFPSDRPLILGGKEGKTTF
jgi:hypothetical protein